jgi:hypothetical protein
MSSFIPNLQSNFHGSGALVPSDTDEDRLNHINQAYLDEVMAEDDEEDDSEGDEDAMMGVDSDEGDLDDDEDEEGEEDDDEEEEDEGEQQRQKEKDEKVQQNQSEMRKMIMQIQQDPTIPATEKAKKIQVGASWFVFFGCRCVAW